MYARAPVTKNRTVPPSARMAEPEAGNVPGHEKRPAPRQNTPAPPEYNSGQEPTRPLFSPDLDNPPSSEGGSRPPLGVASIPQGRPFFPTGVSVNAVGERPLAKRNKLTHCRSVAPPRPPVARATDEGPAKTTKFEYNAWANDRPWYPWVAPASGGRPRSTACDLSGADAAAIKASVPAVVKLTSNRGSRNLVLVRRGLSTIGWRHAKSGPSREEDIVGPRIRETQCLATRQQAPVDRRKMAWLRPLGKSGPKSRQPSHTLGIHPPDLNVPHAQGDERCKAVPAPSGGLRGSRREIVAGEAMARSMLPSHQRYPHQSTREGGGRTRGLQAPLYARRPAAERLWCQKHLVCPFLLTPKPSFSACGPSF